MVSQGSEALLHPLLGVVVATDEPEQEEEQEGAKDDIFDDYTGLLANLLVQPCGC